MVQAVQETGTPVVVVLINGKPLTINELKNTIPAILECWYLGEETGNSIANVLFGNVNPSGKLPVTFPRSVGQLPVYYSQKKSGFFKKYLFEESTPLYPFGYGLSYTTFEYSNIKCEMMKKDIDEFSNENTCVAKVCIDITNTGDTAGDEIVQLYISDVVCSVVRASIELKDFKRISLQPKETKTVKFTIMSDMLSFTNKEYERVVEEGEFEIHIGANSRDTSKIKISLK